MIAVRKTALRKRIDGAMMEGMSQPYTPPPSTVIYRVRINSGEWTDYQTPVKASRFVADNIFTRRDAEVLFMNAASPLTVLDHFNKRIADRLRELGHMDDFHFELIDGGAYYRLTE